MSKTAAAVLAFAGFLLFSIPMSAQFNKLLPNGNVYGGVSYGQLTDIINQQSYRGWEGSAEDFLFARFPHLGIVADGSGYYRKGTNKITQYALFGGPRLSFNSGKWRPFIHAMVGVRHINSDGFIYNPLTLDFGGGADYKLPIRNFSWRVQGDYLHSHYASASQDDYRASTGIVWRF